jgi:hypothetical protein
MRHFFRTQLTPAQVIAEADTFFATLGLAQVRQAQRERVFRGEIGTVTITAKPEGGHYTFVEGDTDQMGESRLDRNVKRFFVKLHQIADPRHKLEAAY